MLPLRLARGPLPQLPFQVNICLHGESCGRSSIVFFTYFRLALSSIHIIIVFCQHRLVIAFMSFGIIP